MKTYSYHARVVSSEKLIEALNEKGSAGYRAISIELNRRKGTALVVFEEELIDGARPFA
jgi:hypothetical protein